MPLIIITGTPCSGKTHRAQQIFQDFESRIEAASGRSVVYLPSYHASSDPPLEGSESYSAPELSSNPRDVVYDSAKLEKTARAEEFSAVKRALNKNVVVIADAPNYIKGFRYQLFCEAKAAGTRSVVVHTAASDDEIVAWNTARLKTWNWLVDESDTLQTTQTIGPRIGKDARGDLNPESHTAIYGDAILHPGHSQRSRNSSMDAASDDEAEAPETKPRRQFEETVTLKSLYIRDDTLSPSRTTDVQPTSISEQPSNFEPTTISTPRQPLALSALPDPNQSLPYSPLSLRSLSMRYEPPSPFTRWDTPLFTIPSADGHPPYDQIWDAIFPPAARVTSKKALLRERQEQERIQREQTRPQTPSATTPTTESRATQETLEAVKPNTATALPTAAAPNALQLLESTTGEVTKLVLAAARAAGVADGEESASLSITIPLSTDDRSDGLSKDLVLDIEKPEGVAVSQPKLQRLRRKFTQIQRGGIAHGHGYTQGRRNVAVGFARFLEGEFAAEAEGLARGGSNFR